MILATTASFAFKSATMRGGMIDGQPVFVAKDVCSILAIDYKEALRRIPAWAKGGGFKAHTLGGNQALATVRESGLFWLILRSKKPEAVAFQRWVCEEVLPALRQSGGYIMGGTGAERIKRLKAMLVCEQVIFRQEQRKAAILSGGPMPSFAVRKWDAPVSEKELVGGVFVRDWLRDRWPSALEGRLAIVAQRLTRRLKVRHKPLGKKRTPQNAWGIIALPADLESVIQPSDLEVA